MVDTGQAIGLTNANDLGPEEVRGHIVFVAFNADHGVTSPFIDLPYPAVQEYKP
jgi:hypothetical protein